MQGDLVFDLSYYLGTGSKPGFVQGPHLIRRLAPNHNPFTTPKRSTASYVYSEQVGTNLHV